jgi:hypothetical protein
LTSTTARIRVPVKATHTRPDPSATLPPQLLVLLERHWGRGDSAHVAPRWHTDNLNGLLDLDRLAIPTRTITDKVTAYLEARDVRATPMNSQSLGRRRIIATQLCKNPNIHSTMDCDISHTNFRNIPFQSFRKIPFQLRAQNGDADVTTCVLHRQSYLLSRLLEINAHPHIAVARRMALSRC